MCSCEGRSPVWPPAFAGIHSERRPGIKRVLLLRRRAAAQRQFLLMPLMHSEELRIQDRGLVEFGRLGDASALDYARRHRELIARFGRFPGRNAALGRRTTPEEQDALDAGAAF